MGMTKLMLGAWVDGVLKPMLKRAMHDGIPLDTFGASLIGYGVAACKGHGMTVEEIRAAFESALTEAKAD